MSTWKKRARLWAVVGIFALLAAAGIFKLTTIEPAERGGELGAQIEAAQALLDGAQEGNAAGEYSWNALGALRRALNSAQTLAQSDSATEEERAAAAQALAEEGARFAEGANQNCLTPQELQAAAESGAPLTRTLSVEGAGELTWSLPCDQLGEAAPVNLQVVAGGSEGDEIAQLLAAQGKEDPAFALTLAFCHNGALPVQADLSLKTGGETAYAALYRYTGGALEYAGPVQAEEGALSFSLGEGGSWVLLPAAGEEAPDQPSGEGEQPEAPSAPSTTPAGGSSSAPAGPSGPSSAGSSAGSSQGAPSGGSSASTPQTSTVTVSIVCTTLLDKLDQVDDNLRPYIPQNGVILPPTKVEIQEGESAFEVLKRVTRSHRIQMEFQSQSGYGSAYIEGIGHLYEKQVGSGSGWMYKVNGTFPNYGCSQYPLKDGDTLVWCYTCDFGKDVGGR